MLSLLGEGFLTTLAIFFLTLIGSLPLGLVVYFGKKSRLAPVRWLVNAYISVMRGTPLMLQLMVVYFGPNLLFGISLPSNWRFIAVKSYPVRHKQTNNLFVWIFCNSI